MKPSHETTLRDKALFSTPGAASDTKGSNSERDSRSASTQASGAHRTHQKPHVRSSKKPVGGSYRIPQQGQLQIIIKNPNKTAVKLFLVPYDLAGMLPGQKTFIRQRSYSAGPIIDMPLSSRKNFGTDRPEAALSNSDDPNDRPILRYLIHLHICCPSEGRFYLYKGVRVVFANRVPDGKEKLRHEVQLPDPRYSAYKPEYDNPIPEIGSSENYSGTATKSRSKNNIQPPAPVIDEFWITPKQDDYFSFAAHAPSPSVSKASQRSSHAHLMSLDVVGEELSPRSSNHAWRPSSPDGPLREEPDRLPEQPVYGKLQKENMQELQRTRSPKPGEGLIARKFRGWTAEKDGLS